MRSLIEPTYWVRIYVAGDADDARRICREFCETGLCVTVSGTDYIYTNGQEAGVVVGLINYPRFPSTPDAIWNRACGLAESLRAGLFQSSVLVMDADKTLWLTSREP